MRAGTSLKRHRERTDPGKETGCARRNVGGDVRDGFEPSGSSRLPHLQQSHLSAESRGKKCRSRAASRSIRGEGLRMFRRTLLPAVAQVSGRTRTGCERVSASVDASAADAPHSIEPVAAGSFDPIPPAHPRATSRYLISTCRRLGEAKKGREDPSGRDTVVLTRGSRRRLRFQKSRALRYRFKVARKCMTR